MKFTKTLFLTLWCLLVPVTAFGQPGKFHDSRDKVTVRVQVSSDEAVQGSDIVVAVILTHDAHWHTHTNDPQVPEVLGSAEDYYETSVVIETPEGSPLTFHEGYTQWPKVTIVKVGFTGVPSDYGVFSDEAVIYIPVTIANDASLGTTSFIVRPVFQACDDSVCMAPTPMPSSSSVWTNYGITVELTIVDAAHASAPTTSENIFDNFDGSVFSKIRGGIAAPVDSIVRFDAFGINFRIDTAGFSGLFLLLLVAMGGGFLLNLTPCVLPVIPIKIMGLSASAGNRRKTLYLGVWMMLGVMTLWLLLGTAIVLITSFKAINELFKYPSFTIVLGIFIGIMAIGMGGLFSIRLPNAVYKVNPKHDSWYGSFLFGVMTAVLSTPCTAPFMGAAAAWATKQSPVISLSVFGAIGFGMAIPYLVLAAFPKLVEKMPRAGAASELIKQVMGLLMLAAAAYFLGVGLSGMYQQEGTPPSRVYLWVVAAFVAASGLWLSWKALRIAKNPIPKYAFVIIGVVIFVLSIFVGNRLTSHGPIDWEYYTPEIVEQRLEEGNTVVLEFTAEWCLNCKWLETNILSHEDIVAEFASDDVAPIKVDLTGNNEKGNTLLNEVGGISIPLLIVLDPSGKEVFRGDFYTVKQVLDAIEESRDN